MYPTLAHTAPAAVAIVLLLTGGFNVLLSFFSIAEWIFYLLAASTVLFLRWREPELPRPFRYVSMCYCVYACAH